MWQKGCCPPVPYKVLPILASLVMAAPARPQGHGLHTYIITVYALKTPVLQGLDKNTTPPLVGYNIHFSTLAKASIVMYFQR